MDTSPEPRRADLSYEIRVLVCPGCGAPYRSRPAATEATCDHCGATHTLEARDETRSVVGDASPDEAKRLAALRSQNAGEVIIPKRFEKVLAKKQYDDDDKAVVERGFKEACEAITAGKGDDGWDLCLYSSVWLHFTVAMGTDILVRRAHAETALGLLKDPRYRHRIRCKLAANTARLGDVDAAERWLASCDPRPADILSDSEYRQAAVMIAYRRGLSARILEVAGEELSDVPIHTSYVESLGTMRADAHEKLGHLEKAIDQLAYLVSRDEAAVVTLASRADLAPFCEKSLPAARERIAAIDASYFNVDYPRLACEHCGADFEIKATTTEVRCVHCNAISAVSLKPMLGSTEGFAGVFPGARDISGPRRKKLLSQRATFVIPPDLAPLFHEGRLRPTRLDDAETAWRKEVRLVAEGDEERSPRLMLLTQMILSARNDVSAANRRHGRAMLETALRVLQGPSYLSALRCTVAISAAEAGDFEAAATWIARCDPTTDVLKDYSALVLAHAKIANLRGDFEETVRLLGPSEGDAPVSLQTRVVVAVLRAAALERLGRSREAVASLAPIVRWAPDARSALVEFTRVIDKKGEPAPTASVPIALAAYRRQRAIVLAIVFVAAVAAWLTLRR